MFVELLEYNNIQGVVALSELSCRKVTNTSRIMRVDRIEVLLVLRVDAANGYIDLSRRRVNADNILQCEDRYNKAKVVERLFRRVVEQSYTTLDLLYQKVAWPLNAHYKHCFDALFLRTIDHTDDVFNRLDIPIEVKNCIIENIPRIFPTAPALAPIGDATVATVAAAT